MRLWFIVVVYEYIRMTKGKCKPRNITDTIRNANLRVSQQWYKRKSKTTEPPERSRLRPATSNTRDESPDEHESILCALNTVNPGDYPSRKPKNQHSEDLKTTSTERFTPTSEDVRTMLTNVLAYLLCERLERSPVERHLKARISQNDDSDTDNEAPPCTIAADSQECTTMTFPKKIDAVQKQTNKKEDEPLSTHTVKTRSKNAKDNKNVQSVNEVNETDGSWRPP